MIDKVLSVFLVKELVAFRLLLKGLVVRSLKSSYTGAAGGVAWVYFKPLFMIFAYYFVFDKVLKVRLGGAGEDVPSYSMFLLSGILPWLVFSESVVEGASCLVREASLLKKTRFPLELIPARSVLTSGIKIFPFLFAIWLVAAIFMAGSWTGFLSLTVWISIQLLLTYYLVVALSILSAALRDVGLLVESLFPLLLFFSPVLYPIEQVPSDLHWLLWLNPFTPLADGYHTILLQGGLPSITVFSIVMLWIVASLLLCRVLINRSKEYIVDWL